MEELITNSFSWPGWPSTLLLLFACLYWVLMMLGAVDLDFLDIDFDMDMDVDTDASFLDLGFTPIRWLNIGSVPTMLWVSVFAILGWVVSRLWNSPAAHPEFVWSTDVVAIIRDFGVAAMLTKVVTQPLRGRFDPVEPNKAKDLIGRMCTITTSEVSATFGEADLQTDAAPLKLKVRNTDEEIHKGDAVVIVDFEPEGNLYFVKKAAEQPVI